MPIDDALSFIFKENLKNIQLIEDFIQDPALDAEQDKLSQQIQIANLLKSLTKRNEVLALLKARQHELRQFKQILIDHIIQNESIDQLKELEKNINLLKINLDNTQKAKRLFLDLIHKKIKSKVSVIKRKKRMSNVYMLGNGIFTAISASFGAAASSFPMFSFILSPLQQGFNFLSYLSWWRAIENDEGVSQEEKEIIKTKLNSIRKHTAGSAIAGMIGGTLLFISAIVPPIAPITLALGVGTILISNILISVASAKDLYREIKHGKKDAARKARISSYTFHLIATVASTLGSTLLLTAAVLALAFPPAAMAVVGAFAIAGLSFIAVNVVSFIASKISLYVAGKKAHLESKENEKNKRLNSENKLLLQENEDGLSKSVVKRPMESSIPEMHMLQETLEQMSVDLGAVEGQSLIIQSKL